MHAPPTSRRDLLRATTTTATAAPGTASVRPWLQAALIVVAGTVAYGNSFRGVFVFDDLNNIVSQPAIREFDPSLLLGRAVYRPVAHLTLAANYAAGGLDVWGYHLVNLLIHLAAGLALFGLVRRTLRTPRLAGRFSGRRADWFALAVALPWLVHPLQTQCVTYVVQRAESLVGLWYLLCLYCLARGAAAGRGWPWYALAAVCCWLGMGTKQVMVTAPVVALAYDRTFLALSWRELLRRRGWLYALFVPAILWVTWDVIDPLADSAVASPAEREPAGAAPPGSDAPPPAVARADVMPTAWEYLRTQPGVILHYLRLAFWPHPLCLDYAWPVAEWPRDVVLPGLVVVGLVAASLVACARGSAVGFVGLAFFLILAPTSSILPIRDLAFEHRMYLPLACVVVLAVLAADALLRHAVRRGMLGATRGAWTAAAVAAIVAAALLLRTRARNEDYRSAVVLWGRTADAAPLNPRAHANLGRVLLEAGHPEAALAPLRRALALDDSGDASRPLDPPERAQTLNNLGAALLHAGDVRGAERQYRTALDARPGYGDALHNLANVLSIQGRFPEAEAVYADVARVEPGNAQARFDWGNASATQGHAEDAIRHFSETLRLRPDHAEARLHRADMYLRTGRDAEAAADLRALLRLVPENSPVAAQARQALRRIAP